ncbi:MULTISPECIES: hypothetical protein [Burkholderia cepacia complex]|uniref:hypothetical protein n=1 Tax=Burkholderia cepacia complex TaxID=87882 RepID=UPI000AC460CD|nr:MULTISPECIES: hypothetical protein [Burkholderia cepacia complex]
MNIDALAQLLIAPAVLAVPLKYAFDFFDGVRKERRGVKGLAFVCWYGPQRRPLNLPGWIRFVASKIRNCFQSRGNRPTHGVLSTNKAIGFIFNSGQVPLKADDLFKSKPLRLVLSGSGELNDVSMRFESDQTADIRLTGERTFLRRPKNHSKERAIAFSYMAPGHGVAVEIEYSARGPVSFSLSGPVNGMRRSIQQQVLFEVDIESSQHRLRQRRSAVVRLWVGGLLMVAAITMAAIDVLFKGDHFLPTRDWTYWLSMVALAVGESMALMAWDHFRQPKKIPAALRYWDTAKNEPVNPVDQRTAVQ